MMIQKPHRQRSRLATGSVVAIVAGIGLIAVLVAGGQQQTLAEESTATPNRTLPETVSFNAHIRPLMSNTCFTCHGPDEDDNESELRLDSFELATESAIVPGKSAESEVYLRIMDSEDPMPPADFRHKLTDYEKALFQRWIDQGAAYQKHWSYTELECPPVPEVKEFANAAFNPIDHFILERLQQEGLKPSPLADKATLLRRLSLDLIGLPPTPKEVNAFLADDSKEAYERQVERLLNSPHYGEQMASPWLDIVRFADTVGYHGDQNQRIFAYRDYVIDSLNHNKPFDQFTREQLAGDLLDNPTNEQLVATGLIRLNMMTREGGAQPAEYLAKYTADRVRMLGTAWLGSTTACCECHSHKYDPFTSKDFYSLGAFFQDVRQWGVYTSYGYTPNPDLAGFSNSHPFPPELRLKSDSLLRLIESLERKSDMAASTSLNLPTSEPQAYQDWLASTSDWITRHPTGWQSIAPVRVEVAKGTPFEIVDDTVEMSGPPIQGESSLFTLVVNESTDVRSVRLEALPSTTSDDRVGRGKEGRFGATVTLQVKHALDTPSRPLDLQPRYLRIELNTKQPLSLAEVEVYSKDDATGQLVNIAATGTATQSTTDYEGPAELAIDGNTSGDYRGENSTTHTKHGQKSAWWELDLTTPRSIEKIVVWNRTDNDFAKRIKGYTVTLLDKDRKELWKHTPDFPKPSAAISIPQTEADLHAGEPVAIDFTQADRLTPARYDGGHDPPVFGGVWRSGPTVWQLPSDETRLPHTAVYHLKQTLTLQPGDELVVRIASDDIAKVRLAVSPLSRYVAGAPAVTPTLHDGMKSVASGGELTTEQVNALQAAYYRAITPYDRQSKDTKLLRDAILECHSGYAMTMISQPLAEDQIAESRVLPRGNWQDRSGEIVQPAIPEFLDAGGHVNSGRVNSGHENSGRLTRVDLADWLTSDENPLVARHYVNRTWKQFFGAGLSNNLDDLGSQGEWPSHPELLDWLACQFRQDWDMKQIARLIVTSHAYRQVAAVRRDLQEVDPYNRLLAQQSARRLEAEAIRDNALAIAGLLQMDYIGGPSVFPYQPQGHYRNLQFPDRKYAPSIDSRQYRRGVYMHWQRTFLHPMLVNFDAPLRDECVAGRTQSNSPQQALTLLNDPSFVEAARALASRLLRENPEGSFRTILDHAFQLALARPATEDEIAALSELHSDQLKLFTANPDQANLFEASGILPLSQTLDQKRGQGPTQAVIQHAAWSQVCRVILNLHETITRF